MKANIAKKWIAALRSGKYKQGRGRLLTKGKHNLNLYCCLGVLEDLYLKEYPNSRIVKPHLEEPHTGTLHRAVVRWAGMRSTTGIIEKEVGELKLSNENDRGASFKKIATIIQNNVKAL